MGREVRRVPKNWEHPKNKDGNYIPLLNWHYTEMVFKWKEDKEKWDKEQHENDEEFYDNYGNFPKEEHYMPEWDDKDCTHYQMYENVSEGTPISPVKESPEELAKWLADNKANAGFMSTASYEAWLNICYGEYAPSGILINGKVFNGVEGAKEIKKQIEE